MLRLVSPANFPVIWMDAFAPTKSEIDEAATGFLLDAYQIGECMNPEHFPRFDALGEGVHSLIVRIYDEDATESSDTVRELTHKIALYYGPGFLLTVHRRDVPWLTDIENTIAAFASKKSPIEALVTKIIQESIRSYDKPIQAGNRHLENFEHLIFGTQKTNDLLQSLYVNRRKAAVFREMLDMSCDLLTDSLFFDAHSSRNQPKLKNLKRETQRLSFYADKLYESISNLIHLHLALASHRTNEVMRILTIFSAFFLPLTFIVGVYGMNFQNIPELTRPYGYFAVWGFMTVLSIGIYLWFRRRGWL